MYANCFRFFTHISVCLLPSATFTLLLLYLQTMVKLWLLIIACAKFACYRTIDFALSTFDRTQNMYILYVCSL